MIKRKLTLMVLVMGIAAAGAMAQTTQGGDMNMDQPKAESVLKRIPADCMGFVMADNLKDTVANIEKFTNDIGLGELISGMAPNGILPTVGMFAGIGDGFNPNGGVAIVVMDFEKCGLDISAMMKGNAPGGEPPIVVLVAGKSVQSAFPAMPVSEDGTQIMTPMGNLFFAQTGQYIAFSPNAQALTLLNTSIENSISKAQKDLLVKSDVALFYNIKVVTPFMEKMFKAMDEVQAENPGMRSAMFPAEFMKTYSDIMKQCDGMTVGLRFADTGILAEGVVEYVPGSDLGKYCLDYANVDTTNMLNRIPDLTYAIAGGMACAQGQDKMMVDQNMMALEMLLGMADLEIPADLKDRMVAFGTKAFGEMQKVQFVIGGPKDAGLFGASMVVECKNAEKMKELLPEEAELLTELIQKTIGMKEEELQTLKFVYTKGVATVAGLSVDAIEVQHEKLTNMEEDKKAEMTKVLAEDKVRFLVAQVDPKTLVVTFGGGESFLASAITAAQKGGPIQTDPGVVQAMKYMPAKPVAVMVLSPANIFTLIQQGMEKMGQESDLPENFKFESKTPLALASAVKGTTVNSVLYIPTSVVKDVYKWIEAEMAGQSVDVDEEEIDIEVDEDVDETPAEEAPAEDKAE